MNVWCRCSFGLVAVMIVLLVNVADAAEAKVAVSRPNILFILADDLGWGDLGCYGHPQIKTPHLDRLARQGTLFTQFYVNGSVCSPSRTAFMTGQFPARHQIHGHLARHDRNKSRGMPNWLDPKAPLITRLLQQAGYATAHFGKWHLGSGQGAPDPGIYGIDVHRTVNTNGPGFEQQRDPYFRAKSTGLFVDEAIRFIESHRDKPFFINLWTLVPHATLHPTDQQMKPYRRFGPGGVPYKGATQIYYATVTALDAELGRLFAKLDELNLSQNTIVLFTSDNGPEDIHIRNASHSGVGSPGPFRGRKRSLYEGGVRMPLIVRWPGKVPAGRINEQSVLTAVDFLPTLCQLAGADLPNDYQGDGEDVSDILLESSRARRRPIMWEWRFRVHGYPYHHSPILAIRDGEWKLLMNPDRSRVELYNLSKDRMELSNLANRHSDVVKRLSARVLAWQKTLPKGPVERTAGHVNYGWPKSLPSK
ncbi:MAG: sulfatase-like hydrolase/transferase [Planctomycetes bacterium]|nr:sulfatase-like hydrolase/transferase [Planctomycetota bacterium]